MRILKDIKEKDVTKKIEHDKHHCILVICAHSDDEILGPGASLAKFSKEGARIYTFIMSYGELTPVWMKHKYTMETRRKEAEKADKLIGGHGVDLFGLKEGHFSKEAEEKGTYERLKNILTEKKPSLIFTHTKEDPHKDHRDTLRIVKKVVKESNLKDMPDVYSFGIWNPFQLHRRAPHLFVDVSKTFKTKLKALDVFRSQRLVILQLIPGVIIKAKFQGFMRGVKYAEIFRKVYLE